MFNELREGGYNLERFRLVCNRMGQESGHLEIEHVEKTLNKKIHYQVPDDWKTVSSAINIGSPLIECAPKSRVRAAIRELAESIMHPESVTLSSNRDEAKSGFLGRIFSGTT
jgi:Flp pilus assembly CpaE family ATPase